MDTEVALLSGVWSGGGNGFPAEGVEDGDCTEVAVAAMVDAGREACSVLGLKGVGSGQTGALRHRA